MKNRDIGLVVVETSKIGNSGIKDNSKVNYIT